MTVFVGTFAHPSDLQKSLAVFNSLEDTTTCTNTPHIGTRSDTNTDVCDPWERPELILIRTWATADKHQVERLTFFVAPRITPLLIRGSNHLDLTDPFHGLLSVKSFDSFFLDRSVVASFDLKPGIWCGLSFDKATPLVLCSWKTSPLGADVWTHKGTLLPPLPSQA